MPGRTIALVVGSVAVAAAVVAAVRSNALDWNWDRLGTSAGIIAIALLVLLFAATVVSVWGHFGAIISTRGAVFTLTYEFVWATLLGLIAIDYLRQEPVKIAHVVGSMPTPVLWFGALGGTMISISGIADRSADGSWRDQWVLWHLLRPVVGVAVALIAVLIFQAGILSIGSDPTPKPQQAQPNNIAYFLIAFLVAYRETTFRELIKRLADTVLTTGTTKPVIDNLTPAAGAGGEVAITGSGLRGVTTVRFGNAVLEPTARSDVSLLVVAPPRAHATAAHTPNQPVPVVVEGRDGAAATTFTYD